MMIRNPHCSFIGAAWLNGMKGISVYITLGRQAKSHLRWQSVRAVTDKNRSGTGRRFGMMLLARKRNMPMMRLMYTGEGAAMASSAVGGGKV
jgi:hypothetical protein